MLKFRTALENIGQARGVLPSPNLMGGLNFPCFWLNNGNAENSIFPTSKNQKNPKTPKNKIKPQNNNNKKFSSAERVYLLHQRQLLVHTPVHRQVLTRKSFSSNAGGPAGKASLVLEVWEISHLFLVPLI